MVPIKRGWTETALYFTSKSKTADNSKVFSIVLNTGTDVLTPSKTPEVFDLVAAARVLYSIPGRRQSGPLYVQPRRQEYA